jgi:uncharacterized membrane protein YdjX (TVP38/TMEM64 family)
LKNKTWLKVSFLVVFLILILVLYESGIFHFFLDKNQLKFFLDHLGPLSFIGFIILQTVQVVVAPIPGEVTGFIGGYLYGPILGIVLSTIGLTLGSFLAFVLSRVLGRPFVEKFVKKETIERYEYLLRHPRVPFLIFLLFLIPGFPKDYLCYILGLGPISNKEFLFISIAGRFSGTVLLTLGGVYFYHKQYYRFSAILGTAIVILLLSMAYKDKLERLFQKWLAYKEASKSKK